MNIVPFGKYKGRFIDELLEDKDYLSWCKKQPELLKKFSKIFEQVNWEEIEEDKKEKKPFVKKCQKCDEYELRIKQLEFELSMFRKKLDDDN